MGSPNEQLLVPFHWEAWKNYLSGLFRSSSDQAGLPKLS